MAFDAAETVNDSTLSRAAERLGESLREGRRSRGLTQQGLASAAGIDLATVRSLERGKGTMRSLLAALCAIEHRVAAQPAGLPVGRWFAEVRRIARYSQQRLAAEAGITKPTVIQIEHERGNLDSLLRIANRLGLDLTLRASREGEWINATSWNARLRFATLCSGIEGVSQAWLPLGFAPAFFAETAPFPSAVLEHRYPNIPNLGDIRRIDGLAWRGSVDVLWASTPCVSFSMAGSRRGLADSEGALTRHFSRLCDEIDPAVLVWENVKGVLADEGNAFGHLLAALVGEEGPLEPAGGGWTNAGAVYGPKRSVAWRVLDAQHAGLAQRRERLYLVGCRRDAADPAEILFERSSGGWDRPPMRTARDVAPGQSCKGVVYVNGDARPKIAIGIAHTLKADTGSGGRGCIVQDGRIRRLTPRESERLMGMADDFTLIPWKGRGGLEAARWQAIGNSVAVPDVRWIGQRIKEAFVHLAPQV